MGEAHIPIFVEFIFLVSSFSYKVEALTKNIWCEEKEQMVRNKKNIWCEEKEQMVRYTRTFSATEKEHLA